MKTSEVSDSTGKYSPVHLIHSLHNGLIHVVPVELCEVVPHMRRQVKTEQVVLVLQSEALRLVHTKQDCK